MANLVQLLKERIQAGRETRPTLSPSAPASCLRGPSLRASSLKHLCWWLKNLTVLLTCFTLDSFNRQVLSYFPCFLPCGWGPASSSAQQAEPGEAIMIPRWTPLFPKGAFLGGFPGAVGLFPQGFLSAFLPGPRGIWLHLCFPLGLCLLFTHLQPISWRPDWPLHFSQGTGLFCSSSSAASAI